MNGARYISTEKGIGIVGTEYPRVSDEDVIEFCAIDPEECYNNEYSVHEMHEVYLDLRDAKKMLAMAIMQLGERDTTIMLMQQTFEIELDKAKYRLRQALKGIPLSE